MKRAVVGIRVGLLAWLLATPRPAAAVELKPEAVQGFDRYVQLTEQRMQSELIPGGAFLWVDGLPEAHRSEAYARLQHGEVMTGRLETRDSAGYFHIPGALIHHWVGTVFIPGASLGQVLTLVQDYDHQQEYYSPEVVRSKILERTGEDFKIYLRLKKTKIVTVVFDTEHEAHYVHLDANRAHSRSHSSRIVEVEHAGERGELPLPAGKDNGFLWRLNSYWRFSETGRGVYVQCEAISLTRDIPPGLNLLIGPFIESIPRESLDFTLRSTRTAVLRSTPKASAEIFFRQTGSNLE
jgi:hypothetical protein